MNSTPKPNTNGLVVLHSVEKWLPLTQNWIYTQIRNLPPEITNHVVCRSTENLSAFKVKNLHDASKLSFGTTKYDALLRRFGFPLQFEKRIIRKHGVHLIHSHFGPVAWANLKLGLPPTSRKHLATFYGFDVNFLPRQPIWKQRYQELFAAIDGILCEGPHMGRCLVSLGCPETKIIVHHLGVQLENIRFAPRIWKAGDPLNILMAASFVEKKGLPYALQALARLQSEVELNITIIGDSTADPTSRAEKERILKILADSGLKKNTRLLGYVPSDVLFEEAYRHHLFLSPSVTAASGDTEGGAPVTIIQMAATGMPVVSTIHCDIPNVIQDRLSGLLAPERDSLALTGCIRDLIANPDLWQRYAIAARQRIETEFNAATQAKRLESIYQNVSSQ